MAATTMSAPDAPARTFHHAGERLVAYTVHDELAVGGEPVKLDAADTSVWVKKGSHWECAMHTESPLGDSYGRDRR